MLKKIVDRGQTGSYKLHYPILRTSTSRLIVYLTIILKLLQVLKSLKRINNVVIQKPDKGNAVVILDRTIYDNSILTIISYWSKVNKLKNDPTLLTEGQLQRFLRNLKKNGKIDNIFYDKIYPSGFQPARIYGLPKMQKFKITHQHLLSGQLFLRLELIITT